MAAPVITVKKLEKLSSASHSIDREADNILKGISTKIKASHLDGIHSVVYPIPNSYIIDNTDGKQAALPDGPTALSPFRPFVLNVQTPPDRGPGAFRAARLAGQPCGNLGRVFGRHVAVPVVVTGFVIGRPHVGPEAGRLRGRRAVLDDDAEG